MTKKEARAFIRKVMGPPTKTLEGKEREQILLLIVMMEPYTVSSNQHSWTECYRIGNTDYHVTTIPDEDVVVEEMLKEEE